MTHYKLTDETIKWYGKILHRIELIEDHPRWGKAGTKGGFVETAENLCEDAWVGDNALVYGKAEVFGNAGVYGKAEVYGNAEVYDNAKVYGNAEVYDNAKVYYNARVYGKAEVFGNARVYGKAEVYGNAGVCGNAEVYDNAKVCGKAGVYGNAEVYGKARVYYNALVSDKAEVCGNAEATRKVHNSSYVYPLTLTNIHIKYGCEQRTIQEWKEFLDSDEVIETPRDDPSFKLIRMALELAIAQHEFDKSEDE